MGRKNKEGLDKEHSGFNEEDDKEIDLSFEENKNETEGK